MKILIILLAIVMAAALFLRLARSPGSSAKTITARPSRSKVAASTAATTGENFRCSSIQCGSGACDSARGIKDKRFLPQEIPSLPLASCDAQSCECRYRHHEDRRTDHEDRRSLSGLSTELYTDSGKSERRSDSASGGRRSTD